jgi:Zn-finger protein
MNYKYFIHQDCTFYPCHNLEKFKSCLFCWCPLFMLDCDGNFVMKNGVKDCSDCIIPHTEKGYNYILEEVKRTIYK